MGTQGRRPMRMVIEYTVEDIEAASEAMAEALAERYRCEVVPHDPARPLPAEAVHLRAVPEIRGSAGPRSVRIVSARRADAR